MNEQPKRLLIPLLYLWAYGVLMLGAWNALRGLWT